MIANMPKTNFVEFFAPSLIKLPHDDDDGNLAAIKMMRVNV
jgi:hypothetical protein